MDAESPIARLGGALEPKVTFRAPTAEDGSLVNDLIARCKPLDENSVYCNLLQCSHFADTCALAEVDGKLAGFVSGYLIPGRQDHLFIWQVAVAPEARGLGLAKSMILHLLDRQVCADVTELHTTITRSNEASQALFSSVAEVLEADVKRKVVFDREQHFEGQAASEVLWRIGPFDQDLAANDISDAA